MEAEILKWGGIASAVAAVGGVLAKAITWYKKKRKEKSERDNAFQNEVLKKLTEVQSQVAALEQKITDTQDAVGFLQCDRLMQAYDYYTNKGYCPTETKVRLGDMYKAYHESGRNTVAGNFKEVIDSLPPIPPKKQGV